MKKEEEIVIPVVEETVDVRKRAVERGGVRVSKVTREHEEVVDTSTVDDEVEIEHVAHGTWLDTPAETRRDGDTIIVPVMEEVLVKRLRLVEEIHIRRKQVTKEKKERVTLRKEEVEIEDTRKKP